MSYWSSDVCSSDLVRAGRLAGELVGGGDILADQILQLLLRCRLIGLGREFPRLLGGLLGEIDDRVDHRLARAMREHHRTEHRVFRKLGGFGFDQDRTSTRLNSSN